MPLDLRRRSSTSSAWASAWRGVWPNVAIETVEDLLYHLPFRYEDRLHPKPLTDYRDGDMASIVGEVRGTALLRTRNGTDS